MENRFLCFESGAFLFLFPLDQVCYIMPAGNVREGWISYEQTEVRAVPFRRFWGGSQTEREDQEEIHVIIGQSKGRLYGMIVRQAVGVMEISEDVRRALPQQVTSEKNRFITGAAYLKNLKRWAYVVDPGILPEIEG